MDWFLYDRELCNERVKKTIDLKYQLKTARQSDWFSLTGNQADYGKQSVLGLAVILLIH